MKKILKLGLLLSGALFATEDNISYGVGVGHLYNGLGANIALQDTESMKYLAIGCMGGNYGSNDGLVADCGLGIGYISTSILSQENNKHGLGVHLGVTSTTSNTINDNVAGVIGYTYFVNEISNSGWNFGITPTITFRDYQGNFENDNEVGVLLNVGYQF